MEREKIQYWSYNCKDGKAIINFEKGEKYIEIDEQDLKKMLDWINMDRLDGVMHWRKHNKNKSIDN